MVNIHQFDQHVHVQALAGWLVDCGTRFSRKFPGIDFASDHWPIKTIYKTKQADWYFTETFSDFAGKDKSFTDVLRCLMAEELLAGSSKHLHSRSGAFRLLAPATISSVYEVSTSVLRQIEESVLQRCKANPSGANGALSAIALLERQIATLEDKGVVQKQGFHVRGTIKAELATLRRDHAKHNGTSDGALLDRKIEAFNETLPALYENDPRLSPEERVAIATTIRLMCAPSRINEVLCSSTEDFVTIEDYAHPPEGQSTDSLYVAHQALLITMKGSKGATWSAKPALSFMIDAFNYSTEVIARHGARSRLLVNWYLKNPASIYLPEEIQYLRGQQLSVRDVAKIIYLTESPRDGLSAKAQALLNRLKPPFNIGNNPRSKTVKGAPTTRTSVRLYDFGVIEKFLLEDVHRAMEECRRVTINNHYIGDLSKMLFLFDRQEMPFKPWAVNYLFLKRRLCATPSDLSRSTPPTLFRKLGITMPVAGKIQIAEIQTHDPRRWLTTQALKHGDKLSDVLINKWANRLNVTHLARYDRRSPTDLATASKPPAVLELADLSDGLRQLNKLEEDYGLKVDIVTVNNAAISTTSMDRVHQAVEDRPVARTSEQIIILYPSWYGACMHQHHEKPCVNYNSCLPCEENTVVKGHLSTNERIRKRSNSLLESVLRQLERLGSVHNLGIADYPEVLGEHMTCLVSKGLGKVELAEFLIDKFHSIKSSITDKLLYQRLEEAYAARGYVKKFDDPNISSGALMKYHNPKYHASPGLEKALDSNGGRDNIQNEEAALVQQFPQFSSASLGLIDQRSLLDLDDSLED